MESWGRGGAGARARAGSQTNPSVSRQRPQGQRPSASSGLVHGPTLSPSMTLTAPSHVSFSLGRRLSRALTGKSRKAKWTALRRRRGPRVLVLASLSPFTKLVQQPPCHAACGSYSGPALITVEHNHPTPYYPSPILPPTPLPGQAGSDS